MSAFKFYHPIEVRYGDLDPQGHVNNAKYLTYIEQARIAYIRHLGLWDGKSFLDVGIILADAHVAFKAPVYWGQAVQVGVRIARLGNKSMQMEYEIQDADNRQVLAEAATILVAYDYHQQQTIRIPAAWRKRIAEFEQIPEES